MLDAIFILSIDREKLWASPPSFQTDVYGRSAMPNSTLLFEMYVGQG